MSRYVQIDKSEMDAFMEAIGFHELSVRERTPESMVQRGRAVKEAVYESEPIGSDGGRIRIYSSVVGGANGKGRDVGKDAIRVQYWVGDQKITGSKRVHRTMNWRKNVLDRVEALRDSVATGPLSRIPKDSSGDYMVVRRYKGNEFWGSSNYPRIRETARFASEPSVHPRPDIEGMIDNPASYYSYWQSFCGWLGVSDAHTAWRMVEKPWKWRPELEAWANDPDEFAQDAESFAAASVAPIKPETPVQKAMMTKWLMDDSERQEKIIKLQTMMKLGLITEDDVLEALNAEEQRGLDSYQMSVLQAIYNRFWVGRYDSPYDMTSQGIGEKIGRSRSNVEGILRELIAKGLVVREKRHIPEFKRKKWSYQITPAGTKTVKSMFGAEETFEAQSFKPPASAVSNAKRGLKLRKEWGRGGLSPSEAAAQGIDSGVTRAKRIASGTVSEHDVRRMSAFNRHRKNYRPDKKESDGGPTAGTIAWLLWGGTSGVNWAKKKSAAMNAETQEFAAQEGICRARHYGNIYSFPCSNKAEYRGLCSHHATCMRCKVSLKEDYEYFGRDEGHDDGFCNQCYDDTGRYGAETFAAAGYDVASWNPADEPTEEEAVWEQFYQNLSSDDELVAKLWDLEGQPGDSAESWWDSLTEETGADDSFASTRQRLENWEAVFERHYELIKEAAYQNWDDALEEMAKLWELEREAREKYEKRMDDPDYTTLWDSESSVVEDGCPVCGDQLSQVSDTVLECNRCEIAWDLIVDEEGFEYLDAEGVMDWLWTLSDRRLIQMHRAGMINKSQLRSAITGKVKRVDSHDLYPMNAEDSEDYGVGPTWM
jgi:DNA-binding MarR family transcriptional regulator